MSRKILSAGIVLFVLFMIAGGASAITFRTETFALSGTGSFMTSPVKFTGSIIAGTLSPGTFWIRFNDGGWPFDNPGTPQNERWDYIFANYFTYDATSGGEGWDGYFPPTGSIEDRPTWRFMTLAGDTLGGTCTQIVITMRDSDADGILDPGEYVNKVISANIVAYINYGGGCFQNFCGQGSLSGTLTLTNGATWEETLLIGSGTSASGRLYLRDGGCTVGVEETSWGKIKSIYRD